MDSFKEFMILNEGYGVSKPFNRYRTFEMFATAPENISKAVKVLQDASFTINSTFNSNLDPKTNIKKGEQTKTPIEAFQYAVDKSSINNGGALLQAMAVAHYVLSNVKSKVDEAEDHGKSNKNFFDKVKMHFVTSRTEKESSLDPEMKKLKDKEGRTSEEETDTEIKKIAARINNLRSIYQTISSKGKNINQIFKNAQDIVSGTKSYFDSSSYDELNSLFVKKNLPPVPPKKEKTETSAEDQPKQETEESDIASPEGTKGEEEIKDGEAKTEKEIKLDRETYRKEINDIVNAKLEQLKKRFNIQEEILKSVDKTLNEMFRKTHDEKGQETEYFQKKKVLSKDKYFKQIDNIKKEAIKKLDELFGAYDEQYITKNKKSRLGIKIRQLIPQLEIDLNNASYKMVKDLTQNEIGIGVDAIKKDVSNVISSTKKAVKESPTVQKVADVAKTTVAKAKDAKQAFDKNVEDAKDVYSKGGDAGLVGKAMDVRKAVNDKLKNVFFGRKKAAETKYQPQPQTQPTQAALPAPQVQAQPQPQPQVQPVQTSSTPIILPDNTPNGLPSPEDIKKREADDVKKRFKPRLRDDNEEDTDIAKKASIDTEKLKKIKKALKNKLQ